VIHRCSLALLLLVFAVVGRAQVAEFSISGGVSRIGTIGNLGTTGSDVDLTNGFRLGLRFTLNTYRFFGHEFGYAYSRSHLQATGTDVSVPIHQGFYDFLIYATPEGSHIRPFATGGVQFSSFFPPGASAYYGNQITKFGINYGGGVKARVTGAWGVRFDIRQYNSGQPFDLPTTNGRLKQTEVSAGVSFNF
jgi:opacity protein-like surface antigen